MLRVNSVSGGHHIFREEEFLPSKKVTHETEIIEHRQKYKNKRLRIGSEYIPNLCHFQCTQCLRIYLWSVIQTTFVPDLSHCKENNGFVRIQYIKK